MADLRKDCGRLLARAWLTLLCATLTLGGTWVYCQAPGPAPQEMVTELRIAGNRNFPIEKIVRHVHTRANRPYDPDIVEEDVRRLNNSRMFLDVKASTQKVEGGLVVIYTVVERPVLREVKYVGPESLKKKLLAKETGLKAGGPMDPYAVEEGRRKIEEYARSKGFPKVHVEIFEGNKPGDTRVVYVIHEGPKQRYLWTSFEGNTFADDGQLRTHVKSKPGFLWFFRGEVNRKEIDEDINRLTAYYRSMGFFNAQVGRELSFSENRKWLTLTFVIHEGPRYEVRNVTVVGNSKFTTEDLLVDTKLRSGMPFNQNEMTVDTGKMQDIYGGEGYVFTDIKSETRFLEEPGKIDLVYTIKESGRYRAGKIDTVIKGDYPHTKVTTALNGISQYPGQYIDTREIRSSERRMKASQLFAVDPMQNKSPKLTISKEKPSLHDESEVADEPPSSSPRRGFRGQSPDPAPPRNEMPPQEAAAPPVRRAEYDPRFAEGDFSAEPPMPVRRPTGFGPAAPREAMPDAAVEPANFVEPMPMPPSDAWSESETAGPGAPTASDAWTIRGQSPGGAAPSSWQPVGSRNDSRVNAAVAYEDVKPAKAGGALLRWSTPPVAASSDARRTESNSPSPVQNAVAFEPVPDRRPVGEQGFGPGRHQVNAPLFDPFGERAPATRSKVVPVGYDDAGVSRYADGSGTYGGGGGYATPSINDNPPGVRASQLNPRRSAPQGTATGAAYPPDANGVAPATAPGMAPAGGAPLFPGPVGAPPPSSAAPNDPNAGAVAQAPLYPGSISNQFGAKGPPLYGNRPDEEFPLFAPLNAEMEETTTGKFMLSVGVNSDAGLVGSVVIDEQNFDWTRIPRSWEEIRNGTGFRGAGQRLRLEAMPGTQVQRYSVSFTEPYLTLWGQDFSETLSGFYYDRQYNEYLESRGGGRVGLGYKFRPDLWGTLSYRGENVCINRPMVGPGVIPDLDEVVGSNGLHGFRVQLTNDTRDSTALATEGYLFEVGFEQVIGAFNYPRGDIDMRKYFLLRQHPDGTQRHVLSLNARAAITGSDTPLYEHYFAGGFTSIRGFSYRGASPRDLRYNFILGGHFMMLASAEYLFPITADDTLRGVVFCDTGTVEKSVSDWDDQYRAAVGFGLRITVPMMGPQPIALDFAFPVSKQAGDDTQVFSFFVGWMR